MDFSFLSRLFVADVDNKFQHLCNIAIFLCVDFVK